MKELAKEKGVWAMSLVCFLAMTAGIPFYEINLPLETGSFLKLYRTALHSQMILFLIPIVSVLPAGAAYVKESSNGFIKMYITRISRMEYIKKKTLQVYASGFLSFFPAGIVALLLSFLFLYPLELKGSISGNDIWEALFILLRICLTGGIMAEISGIFAAVFCNYYMAYGLPFVCYYLLIILKDRYLPDMYVMYPVEWIAAEQNWGTSGNGIWVFFLVFSVAVILLHGLLLYHRLREI